MQANSRTVLLAIDSLLLAHLWRQPISFKVNAGEILQIKGANGSGKTSLIKILCGLVPADSGNVLWQNVDIDHNIDDYRQQIAYIGHKDGIKADLTPNENLAVVQALRGNNDISIDDALKYWQLTDASMPCRLLSVGQRRRVALARLSVVRADLWLLDEPLTALDDDGQDILGKRVAEHLDSGGSVVMATHQSPDWHLATQTVVLG